MSDNRLVDLYNAIRIDKNYNVVKEMFDQYPELVRETIGTDTWLHVAATAGSIEIAKLCLERGIPINAVGSSDGHPPETALWVAIINDASTELIQFLIENGAESNLYSPAEGVKRNFSLYGAIRRGRFDVVKLLVEYGADVNLGYSTYTPLSLAQNGRHREIAEYLISKGAISHDAPAQAQPVETVEHGSSLTPIRFVPDAEYLEWMSDHFQAESLIAFREPRNTDPWVTVHLLKPTGRSRKRKQSLIITTAGVSDCDLTVPEDYEEYMRAELFMCLPGNWPTDRETLEQPEYAWLFEYLQSIGDQGHETKAWFGAGICCFAHGEPPKPISERIPYVASVLLTSDDYPEYGEDDEGCPIHFYRVVPIYADEHEFAEKHGVQELVERLEEAGLTEVFDPNRASVAMVNPKKKRKR